MKESIQFSIYAITLVILWRFSVRQRTNRLLRVIALYFFGETLDQSADVLFAIAQQVGNPLGLLIAWHIYTRLVFLVWLAGVTALLWSMLGNQIRVNLRDWIGGKQE